MAKRKKTKQTPETPPRRRTYTFGIFALLIGILIFTAMVVTRDENQQAAIQPPTQEELDARYDPNAGVEVPADPTAVDPVFAAVSFGAVVAALALISWIKGEGVWLGGVGIALCIAGVWLDWWIAIVVVSALLIVAGEIAVRRLRAKSA